MITVDPEEPDLIMPNTQYRKYVNWYNVLLVYFPNVTQLFTSSEVLNIEVSSYPYHGDFIERMDFGFKFMKAGVTEP